MVGRELAFADPEVVRLATRSFVPVAADDWYMRRRTDAEGQFFKLVSEQSPRKGTAGSRQGIYVLTAAGDLLGFTNQGHDPAKVRDELTRALARFAALPPARRGPGAVSVPPHGPDDPNYGPRRPPPGTVNVNVFTRILDYTPDGYHKGKSEQLGGDKAARDHLWVTADDVRAMAAAARPGDRVPLPPRLAERIARFHLVDNTSGEPVMWDRREVRGKRFTLTATAVTADAVDLTLDGEAMLLSDPNPSKADRGFLVRLTGAVRVGKPPGGEPRLERFDAAAVGEHWGEAPHAGKARPGRSLLGVAFEVPTADRPGDRLPPQGVKTAGPDEYLGR